MIPDFFQSSDTASHLGLWKPLLGLFIVLLGTCVGVEIRVSNDEDDV